MNKVQLEGFVGKDPELRYTQQGKAVCTFSLATSDRPREGQPKRENDTQWHRVVCWGDLAERMGKEVHKGALVKVPNGKIQYSTWEDKQGVKRYQTEIVAFAAEMIRAKGEASRNGEARERAKSNDDTFQDDTNDIPF